MYEEYINYGASTVEILDEYIASKEQYLKILDKFSVTDINLLQYDIQFVLSNKIPIDTLYLISNKRFHPQGVSLRAQVSTPYYTVS